METVRGLGITTIAALHDLELRRPSATSWWCCEPGE